MTSAPPVTPPEVRFARASEATLSSDRRLERHRAADRIHHGSRQHRGSSGFGRRGFEMNAQFLQYVLGVGQHIHQMRDRSALIAAHIGDTRLQQRLGDRQDSLAAELLTGSELEVFDLARKRPFGHECLLIPAFRAVNRPGRNQLQSISLRKSAALATRQKVAKRSFRAHEFPARRLSRGLTLAAGARLSGQPTAAPAGAAGGRRPAQSGPLKNTNPQCPRPVYLVMAGLVPAIHVFGRVRLFRRGCPRQAPA